MIGWRLRWWLYLAERVCGHGAVLIGPETCPHGLYVWMPCSRCVDAEVERLHAERCRVEVVKENGQIGREA